MKEELELLPCPFCGGTDIEVSPASSRFTGWSVRCKKPYCASLSVNGIDNNHRAGRAKAVMEWNIRKFPGPAGF